MEEFIKSFAGQLGATGALLGIFLYIGRTLFQRTLTIADEEKKKGEQVSKDYVDYLKSSAKELGEIVRLNTSAYQQMTEVVNNLVEVIEQHNKIHEKLLERLTHK